MEENNELNFNNRIDLEQLKQAVLNIKESLGKVIIGQENFIDLLLVALLADGHVLIEGVPGSLKATVGAAPLISNSDGTGKALT